MVSKSIRSFRSLLPALSILAGALPLFCCKKTHPEPTAPVVLFTRNYLEPLYQEDRPAPQEIQRPIQLAATPGEDEPAALGVWSRSGLRQARLQVSDLSGPAGAVIPGSAVEILVTRYITPFERWPKLKEHPLHPGFLAPAASLDLAAHKSQQFWLTVRVPPNASPGTYRAEVTLTAAGIAPLSLPLELQVFPFRLEEARPALYVMGDNFPLEDARFESARRHGMNTICVAHGYLKRVAPVYRDGQFTYSEHFPNVVEVVERARRHGLAVDRPLGLFVYSHLTRSIPAALAQAGVKGPDGRRPETLELFTGFLPLWNRGTPVEKVDRFKGPYFPTADPYGIPTSDFGKLVYKGWVNAFRELENLARSKGWPPVFHWLIDEPHKGRGSMRLALTMVRAAEEAGVNGMVTCNEPTVSEPNPKKQWFPPVAEEPALLFGSRLRTRCYNNSHLSEETRQRTSDAHAQFGTYVNIYGNAPAATRYQAGFLAWRLKLDQVMFWNMDKASTESDGRRIFLRDWEAVREGIDDLRYMEALERAVAAGRGSAAARADAVTTLEAIRKAVIPSARATGYVDSISGEWVPGKGEWTLDRFDALRRQAAEMLIRLNSAPAEKD